MDKQLNTKYLLNFLDQVPVLQRLPVDEKTELLAQAKLHSFDKRTVIQASGTNHHHLYIVVTGQLDMCAIEEDGSDMVVAVFGPHGTTSWMALFHETPAVRELVANPDTRVLALPAALIRGILERNPHLYPSLLKLEAERFRVALNREQLSQIKDRNQRIAALLLIFIDVSGDKRKQPEVTLTSEKLAKAARCSRQTFYTTIKELSRRGLVRQEYGKIVILDIEKLKCCNSVCN